MLIRGVSMMVMATLSLVGNMSVIAATLSSSLLHNPSHVLVAVLCFFHLLSAALNMIPIAVSCLTEQWIGGGKTLYRAVDRGGKTLNRAVDREGKTLNRAVDRGR